jgi:16S rRNA (cytosine1402-N4)-methyltransferase
MDGEHISVLLAETLDLLAPRQGDIVLDGTVGGGGHARMFLERVLPGGRLIGLDRDDQALVRAARVLPGEASQCTLLKADFTDFPQVLDELGVPAVDVALLDLGVSSFQIDDPERGFSFQKEGPLDMRMDRAAPLTAADVVNELDEQELADIFYKYGEERLSRRIARFIMEQRHKKKITTTGELAGLVLAAQPRGRRGSKWQRIHPATRVFQALRIYVNGELESLEQFCETIASRLRPGGRVGIISFHSLEDRIVKHSFRKLASAGLLEVVTRKPVTASEEETRNNPRSRSAKLRVARAGGGPMKVTDTDARSSVPQK